jgi:hypothetical protein
MNPIDPFILQVRTAEGGLGTGLIVLPEHAPDQAYVLTALHLLREQDHLPLAEKTGISLVFHQQAEPYTLTASGGLLIGDNLETEDLAILIVPRSALPAAISSQPGPRLISLGGQEQDAVTSGYPKATENRHRLSLYQCRLLGDREYPDELQLEVSDPLTENHDAADLVEGYSGSPVYLEVRGAAGIAAIFLGYDELTRRIKAMRCSFVNILLGRNGLPELALPTMETDTVILDDLAQLQQNTARVLRRIQTDCGGIRLERSVLGENLRGLLAAHKLTIVYGRPGMGKSALVKAALTESGDTALIALQGEQLDRPSIKAIFSDAAFGIRTAFEKLLDSPALPAQKILLVDSIEKLLETTNADTVIDLFSLLRERQDLRLVLTTRSYALDQLKLRFLQQYSSYGDLEVTALREPELSQLTNAFPFLVPLLAQPSLKRILEIPFNIDKATRIKAAAFNGITSERAFKTLMWEQLIEQAATRPIAHDRERRARTFTEAARQRATALTPYVAVTGVDAATLAELVRDELLEADPVRPDFVAPAHDIYEDWALTRLIEAAFRQHMASATIQNFYAHIGEAPAMRRAFRLWIAEELHLGDYNIADLISRSLHDPAIGRQWQDEILIAILQSPYSQRFLATHQDLLLADGHQLFRRCALLLRVACQTPDLRLVPLLDPDEQNYIYHNHYLRPYGDGWANLLYFIEQHLDELEPSYAQIVPVVRQWQKTLQMVAELPPEAASAARIQYQYFRYFLAHYDEEGFEAPRERDDQKGIELLYRTATLIPDQAGELLDLLLARTARESYKISGLLDDLGKKALSFEHSLQLAKLFPDKLIALARRSWFYHRPTAEELEQSAGRTRLLPYIRQESTEEQFGVKERFGDRYSPPCAYQTPVWHLLNNHPREALAFLLELFDHSAESMFASDYLQRESTMWPDDQRRELTLVFADGQTVTQKASRSLWNQYSGRYIATPYLLTALLMTLEKWLLGWAEMAADAEMDAGEREMARQLVRQQADQLLRRSHSIAVSAVVVSAAKAYPDLLADLVLPVLEFPEVYDWDLNRVVNERGPRPGGYNVPDYIKKEVKRADAQPQHRIPLHTFVQRLNESRLQPAVYALLDRLKAAARPEDTQWRLLLVQMDLRDAEVLADLPQGRLVQPKIDLDLEPVVEEARQQQAELQPVRRSGDWNLRKWQNETVDADGYAAWQEHYRVVSRLRAQTDTTRLFVYPGITAAIGIRDYFDQLSAAEKDWCIEKIFYIATAEIQSSHQAFPDHQDKSYSAFDPEPALWALVALAVHTDGETRQKARGLLFAGLIYIHNDLQREVLFDQFRTVIWPADPGFALAIIAGLVRYAGIAHLYQRIRHYQPAYYYRSAQRRSKWGRLRQRWADKLGTLLLGRERYQAKIEAQAQTASDQWLEDFNAQANAIAEDVLEGEQTLVFPATVAPPAIQPLTDAFSLLPVSGHADVTAPFLEFMITFMAGQVHRDTDHGQEKIPYELQQHFTKALAAFLLHQPAAEALATFTKLWNEVFHGTSQPKYYNDPRVELIKMTLKEMLWALDLSGAYPHAFWAIWQFVAAQRKVMPTRAFDALLLFNSGLRLNQAWPGLAGHQGFFKDLIRTLSDVEETARLLSGIGFDHLMPEALEWYSELIRNKDLAEEKAVFLTEKLIINTYYNRGIRQTVKGNYVLRSSLAHILDRLIDASSATAFVIRDDLLSVN